MSTFELNDEKAIDLLIFWVGGADGDIDYEENQAIYDIIDDMEYSPESYFQDTMLHISGLSTENVHSLINDAIAWCNKNFSDTKKRTLLTLLKQLASSDSKTSDAEQEKIDELKSRFGLN